MKLRLIDRKKLMRPTQIDFLKFVPILMLTFILLVAIGVGIADPTTSPPSVPK